MKIASSIIAGLLLFLSVTFACVTCQDVDATGKVLLDQAVKDQTAAGYKADRWKLTALKPGDVVYGGVPGQTAYYTTQATLDASELDAVKLFKSLQVKPHPTLGYRVKVCQYTVRKAVTLPSGKALANPELGTGGGDQFFISDFKNVLKPGPVFDLKK